jgi:hypothetical protein
MTQLDNLFKKRLPTMSAIYFCQGFFPIQYVPQLDSELERIHLEITMECDFQFLMKFLASPRADGRQRVVHIKFDRFESGPKMVEVIKNVKKYLVICFFFYNI